MKSAIFAISLAASTVSVVLSGLLAAALQDWFGVSDLMFLVIWFVPAGLVAAGLTSYLFERVAHWSLFVRYVLGIGFGACVGVLWTFLVARLLGPWWGAVSLPALMCWMAGGASSVAGGLTLGPGSSARFRVGGLLGLLVIAGAGAVLNEPLAIQLHHDQTLTVRFLEWTPGNQPLTIETDGISSLGELTGGEVALIRAAQPTGRLVVVWGGSRHGRGPVASALILVKQPIKKSVTIQQPDRTTALYVQDDQGFAIYPPTTKTLDREITLSPQEGGVWCSVRIANGGVQSGPVRIR